MARKAPGDDEALDEDLGVVALLYDASLGNATWDHALSSFTALPLARQQLLAAHLFRALEATWRLHSLRSWGALLDMLSAEARRRLQPTLADRLAPYRLTATEARLVEKLAGGLRLADAAREMRIATSTARTHLNHVFAKTGVRSQARLMRLVMEPAA
jgi:DNA-binding CsgD family transcriptional regulator